MNPARMPWRSLVVGLTAGTLALATTACGSSDDAASSASTAPAGTGTATAAGQLSGEPVNVGFIDVLSGSDYAFDQPAKAAQIAAQAVNDQGGINGRPLKVIVCDTKGQPANGIACARKLVNDDKVVAFIGGNSGGGIDKIGAAKSVANWFAMGSNPSDINNPLSFITALNSAGPAQGAYLGAKRFGAKSAVFIGTQGGEAYTASAQFGFAQAGVTDVKVITAPGGTTDYTPLLAKVKAADPDVWGFLAYPPKNIAPIVDAAAQLGIEKPLALSENSMDNAALEAISQAPFPNSIALEKAESSELPVWKEYEEQLKKYDPKGEIDAPTDGSVTTDWLAVWTFAKEARKLDQLDAASFSKLVGPQSDFDAEILHELDFTKPSPIKDMPRQVNIWAYQGHAADGKIVLDDKEPFSAWQKTPIAPWTAEQIAAEKGGA